MEGENQHGNCSYDDKVKKTTSVLSNGGPQNPALLISQEPPKEIKFFEVAPPANQTLDLSLGLSLGGFYKEIKKSPNSNLLSLTATRATALENVNPPITTARNNNGILPPLSSPLPPPLPLPPSYTEYNNNLDEIASSVEAQEKRRFEAYRRLILRRRRAHERAEAKKEAAAAAAASPPAPPLAAAVAAQPPQGPPPKPIMLPGVVASDVENRELYRAVEKINALGDSSGKKILEGIGSWSSQQPWTSHQPNLDAKTYTAKATYGKSAIIIENISQDERIKRPRLPNAVQNSNAPQKDNDDNGMKGVKQLLTVTTIGDGLEGKKVDGFLYRYSKGGHIFIVCLCHGVFLSPTDFVKHANHTDWSNPMKHIAVSSSPLPF